MIKYSEIQSKFKINGIDAIEYNYESNEEIETPFVVYTILDIDKFVADGTNYLNLDNIRLALIDGDLNKTFMDNIEKTLNENNITYDKSIDFDEDNRLYSIQYSFSVIDG